MAETFGALLKRLRETAGRSQTEQATELCRLMGDPLNAVTRTEVSRYECGRRLPRPRMVRVFAQSFGVPEGELLRLRAAAAAHRSRKAARITVDSDGLVEAAGRPEEHDVRRRQFVGAAALGAGLASAPWGRLAYAIGQTGPATADDAQVLADRTAALFAAEEQMPARQLYGTLAAHLDHLAVVLGVGGPQRRGLLVSAGETAALAGWLAYDMGDLEAARHYYATATQAGQEAGHPPLLALVLAYTSYALEDPRRARDMLRAAQQHVRAPGCATARAWVSAREAEESAAIGDRDGALRAMERAQAVYDYAQPDDEQPWVRFFSRARLDSMAVATYARLDHPDLGEVSEAALRSLKPDDAKVRAVILGDVATAYVVRGELERGSEVAREALQVTRDSEATLGRQRLIALAQQLPAGDRTARQLQEELRML